MAPQPPPAGLPGQQPQPQPQPQPPQQPQLLQKQNLPFHPQRLPQNLHQTQQTQEVQEVQQTLQPVAGLSSSPATASGSVSSPSEENKGKKSRARKSRPKVKTGCNNCKQRHIKCDEKRPVCTQCLRAKKTCSGYPPPIRRLGPFGEVPIAPRPQTLQPAPAAAAPVQYGSIAPRPTPVTLGAQSPALLSSQRPMQSLQPAPLPRSQQLVQAAPRRIQKLQQRHNAPLHAPFTPPATFIPTMLYTPSLVLPYSQREGMYFELFRLQTASELSGFFDDKFWSRSVLIECQSSAAIRHAVVALGALYKTLETTTASPPSSPGDTTASSDVSETVANHWEVALNHYSSACRTLALMNPNSECTHRTILMASVLLACFDSFIGDHKQAIVQIQNGMSLLHRIRGNTDPNGQKPAVSGDVQQQPQQLWQLLIQRRSNALPIEDELLQMFTRLAIQAKSYDLAFHFPQPYVIQFLPPAAIPVPDLTSSAPSPPSEGAPSPGASSDSGSTSSVIEVLLPQQFTSLREARLAWDAICESFFCFTESMAPYATAPPNLLPKYMRGYGKHLAQNVESWSNAFAPLMASRLQPGVSSQEKAAIAVLKMFQVMGQILYLMTFNHDEMQFDVFRSQFQEILTLAWEVVGDEEQRAAMSRCPDRSHCAHDHRGPKVPNYCHPSYGTNHIKASFSANLGIVPPLYVVATKSRDRVLRRQAIHLLRSSARREGMWDSELMARVGAWVMSIEEEGVDDVPLMAGPAGPIPRPNNPSLWMPIPAGNRILVRSCEFDLRGHKAMLRCGTRDNMPGQEDKRARTAYIEW